MAAEYPRQSRSYQRFVLPLLKAFGRLLMLVLGPLRVTGAYRVPRNGGLLVLANHISDCDPPVVQFACPRPIHYMAKSDLFSIRILGRIIRFLGAFPVRRDEADRPAIRHAIELLRDGQAVGVFPEGEASETGELNPLKPGIALIARAADVPIVCCGLIGTNRVIPYGKVLPRPSFRRTQAIWGEPRRFDSDASTEAILAWVEGQLRTLTNQELY